MTAQNISVKTTAANKTEGLNAFTRLIVEPNSNPKNGRMMVFPPLKTSLIFVSRLPKINPRMNGIRSENIYFTFIYFFSNTFFLYIDSKFCYHLLSL